MIGSLVIGAIGAYDAISQLVPDCDLPTVSGIVSSANSLAWWDWKVWIIIGFVFLTIGIFRGAYSYVKDKTDGVTRLELRVKELEYELSGTDLIKEARNANVIKGLWHTGASVRQARNIIFPKLEKVLLLYPDKRSDSFQHLTAEMAKNDNAIGEIVTLTRDILDYGRGKIEVGWYRTLVPNTFTIFQHNDDTRICVQVLEQNVDAKLRQRYVIEKDDARLPVYITIFDDLWGNSDKVILENGKLFIIPRDGGKYEYF